MSENKSNGINIKMLILAGLVVIILIAASIGATLYFTGFFSGGGGGGDEHKTREAKVEEDFSKQPPMYLDIKPGFVANAIEGDNLHYIMAEVSLMSRNQKVIDAAAANMLAIRNNIREALSGHIYSEIMTMGGLERLRSNAEEAVNSFLEHHELPKIDALYFSSIVVQ